MVRALAAWAVHHRGLRRLRHPRVRALARGTADRLKTTLARCFTLAFELLPFDLTASNCRLTLRRVRLKPGRNDVR
jgi:hypothetical protein